MGFHLSPLPLILFISASLSLSVSSTTLPTAYSILGPEPEATLPDSRVLEIFQRWRETHRREYRHAEEFNRRLENFRRNLKYVLERNAKGKGHKVGLNKFADLSNEEFRKVHLSKIKMPAKRNGQSEGRLKSCDAPSSFDWRKYGVVTGVKDQGDCGSCWAFSSTGAMEGINALVTGDLISLSEQELVDCDTTNYGCEGGYMDYAFEWVINNAGIDTEADYPYTGIDGTCNATKETKIVTINGYEDVDESDSALLCAVVQQPVSVGIDASSIDFQLYTSGVFNGSCSDDPDEIDHAVLIVGYGSEDGENYWIVKNSWGTSWGIEGYFYLKRDPNSKTGVCAVNAMASYPTKESSSPSPFPSPGGSPPPPPPPSSPPPPPPPPPPPSPSPSDCGEFSYCASDETCCCIEEFFGFCLMQGCCEYENAVCCTGTEYCCPSDYPICDIQDGLCLKNAGDSMGVEAKRRKMAKHKLPWSKSKERKETRQHLKWKNPFVAVV